MATKLWKTILEQRERFNNICLSDVIEFMLFSLCMIMALWLHTRISLFLRDAC